jgi:hypothetical protein
MDRSEGAMRDWILCRLKVSTLLVLFFAPVVLLEYNRRQLMQLESLNYVEPVIPIQLAEADFDSEATADMP